MNKPRMATLWLDGCSGCHMSVLDMDERILEILGQVELVYSPLVDTKEFPSNVTLTLVEGAIASKEDAAFIQRVRANTKWLVALGDCAITGNVPGMRNAISLERLFGASYQNLSAATAITELLPQVLPLHQVVPVDLFLPGCPPPVAAIYALFQEFLWAVNEANGDLEAMRFTFDATQYTGFGR